MHGPKTQVEETTIMDNVIKLTSYSGVLMHLGSIERNKHLCSFRRTA